MQSLRLFHFVFVLAAIIIADMFGAWAVWEHSRTKETDLLVWGVVSFLIGFTMIGYAIWMVRKLDRAKIE